MLLGVLPVGCLFCMNGLLGGGEFITIAILFLGISASILSSMIYTDDIAKIGTVVGEVGQVLDLPELNRPKENKKFKNRDIPLEQIMDEIAYVSQDNYLFNDTIANNIRLGKPEATQKEVREAAKTRVPISQLLQ